MHVPTFRLRTLWPPAVLALIAVGAGYAGSQVHPTPPERHNALRAAYMRTHFYQAMLLHDALARGDLEAARLEAAHLQQQSPNVPMPVGAEAFHGAVTRLAGQAANATSLKAAAQSTAAILGTCGQCHRAMQVRASLPKSGEIKVGGLVGHMLLHQHGSDALIEGLVGPSDSSWGEGVRTFAAPKLDASHAPGKIRKEFGEAETALAQLAGEAAQARRSRDRETVYGRMLATCGECHRTVSRHAGPGR